MANNIAEVLLNLENLTKAEIYFEWKLIGSDPDDNKYVDAAIAAGADFIVSNDSHFRSLADIDFPKIKIINTDQFLKMIVEDQSL